MASGWAIIGTGAFAGARIAPALNKALGCRLVAVVSRERDRAEAFAQEHGAPRAYDDLHAALRDPDVQCVWVATPHALHLEPVLAAAAAGKHVL
ncbi:MAG TPA: Gfo/Idh/MocA family oxidoreductase, partial [Dehalococcoidia bacterium]|nr:Gfo/Idh/MocA family oxidoreductase [Dehalococcoidia bacterium]